MDFDGFSDFKPSIFWYLHFKKPELITKSWSPKQNRHQMITDLMVGGLYGWTKRKTRKNRCSRATLATGRAFLASSRFQAAGKRSCYILYILIYVNYIYYAIIGSHTIHGVPWQGLSWLLVVDICLWRALFEKDKQVTAAGAADILNFTSPSSL